MQQHLLEKNGLARLRSQSTVTTAAAVVLAEADGVSPNTNNLSDTRQTPQRPLTLEDLT